MRPVFENLRFCFSNSPFTCGGKAKWKKLRFQKYTHLCGRGVSWLKNVITLDALIECATLSSFHPDNAWFYTHWRPRIVYNKRKKKCFDNNSLCTDFSYESHLATIKAVAQLASEKTSLTKWIRTVSQLVPCHLLSMSTVVKFPGVNSKGAHPIGKRGKDCLRAIR